jgi:hypothetical protein
MLVSLFERGDEGLAVHAFDPATMEGFESVVSPSIWEKQGYGGSLAGMSMEEKRRLQEAVISGMSLSRDGGSPSLLISLTAVHPPTDDDEDSTTLDSKPPHAGKTSTQGASVSGRRMIVSMFLSESEDSMEVQGFDPLDVEQRKALQGRIFQNHLVIDEGHRLGGVEIEIGVAEAPDIGTGEGPAEAGFQGDAGDARGQDADIAAAGADDVELFAADGGDRHRDILDVLGNPLGRHDDGVDLGRVGGLGAGGPCQAEGQDGSAAECANESGMRCHALPRLPLSE